ncbi:MAG: porin family protein [Bacteroidales bacterium]|nr:porin family protein [Bacteroidales bacterium]
MLNKPQLNTRQVAHHVLFLRCMLSMALIFATVFHVQAQNRFDAIAFVGMNMSQIDGDGAGNYNHIGLHAGIGTTFSIDADGLSPWRIGIAVGFSQKGSYIEASNRQLSANYVEIPISVGYTALNGQLRLSTGIAPALLVGASVTNNGIDDRASSDNFKKVDALPFFVYATYFLSHHWGVGAQWQTSMLSITKQNGSGTYRIWRENKGAFNRLFSLHLAYKF